MSDNELLVLHAVTGLHPGSGTALGVVDLPIQRERHTNWPLIPGSSLKGVLREALRPEDVADDEWLTLFGPTAANASDHAGALAFTDARILAFPVRSLKGVFAWVTCPAVLARLARDLEVIGRNNPAWSVPDLNTGSMLCAEKSPILIDTGKAVLEEFDITRSGDLPAGLVAWFQDNAAVDDGAKQQFSTHLAILADNDFTHFVQYATEINARVGLNYETRTVKDGALFYEEFLPPETLLYALVLAQKSRRKEMRGTASEMLGIFRNKLPPTVQIGAGETIGKGICRLRLSSANPTTEAAP
jgi:CRISPR-associated protein Cmr4